MHVCTYCICSAGFGSTGRPKLWDSYIFGISLFLFLLLQSVQPYLHLSFPYSFSCIKLVKSSPLPCVTHPSPQPLLLLPALTLEYLEQKFYMEGLAQFKQADFVNVGFPDPFCANLQVVYYDE